MNKKIWSGKFVVGIILILISLCAWRVCSLIGNAKVSCMVICCALNVIGLSKLDKCMFQVKIWTNTIAWVIATWSLLLFIIVFRSSSNSDYPYFYDFIKHDFLNEYRELQVMYILTCLLVLVVLAFYIVKIQEKERSCLNYFKGFTICVLVNMLFFHTNHHKSTPIANFIIDVLYFSVILYLIFFLFSNPKEITLKYQRLQGCIWGVLFVCTIGASAWAIKNRSIVMDFEYQEYSGSPRTIELVKYTGEDIRIKVPGEINGLPISTIDDCFSWNFHLKRVSIPDGVKELRYDTFEACLELRAVSLPDSLEVIGPCAFICCEKLQEIKIPLNVRKIGRQAFFACWSLQKIELPPNISTIEKEAFYKCFSLEEIVIPEGVTVIEDSAFSNCYKLKRVVLPESLKRIECRAFQNCRSLKEVAIPAGVEYISEHAFDETVVKGGFFKEAMIHGNINKTKED